MTKTETSGAASQTGLSGAMADVVYTANDGYYFPENYSVTAVNGISVTRNSYTQITVSGTPTADAAITLTAPTAKTTPDAPTAAAATDCTTADNNDGKLTGVTAEMEYKKSDATEWTAGTGNDITGLVPGTYYVRVKATDTTNASGNQELTVKGFISYTVTFKVVNGKWNEGEGDAATADKTVTLTGHDGDTLKLTADQIPAVGTKPNDTYKVGSWDVTPSTDTAITEATTYTYTYAQKDDISQTVTFKVVNGSWNDETTTDKTVTLTGYEGDTLKLAANQIPAVGDKPNDTYKAGSWDVTPSTDTAITEATTYTYTYVAKEASVVTKAPEAKTLTYNGQVQELVTAGTATGGEMKYALGNATEATQPYTTSIPTATNAGTYYVWYMVKGDDNHNNTDPARVQDPIRIDPVDKSELNAAIASAEAYYDSIKDNAAYADIAATLKKALDAAKAVAGNDNATKDAVAGMVSEVGNAANKARDDVAAVDKKAAEEEAAKKAAEEEAAKQAADEAAAKAVTDAINALPENAGAGDKAAVEAARRAYDALTEDQKKLVPGDALSKLAAAEQQVAAAGEAAETVKISACKIRVKSLAYTGKRIKKPTVTVTYKGQKLKEGTDYTFTYNKKAKAIGAYRVTVKGKGRFTGSKKVTLKVVPKGTVFSKVAGGDKLVFLKWKSRRNITGYQIEYSLKKDFSDRKRVTIKKAKAPAKTPTKIIKKLKAGKTYYVRIRTYTTVKKKNYFSAWSKAKAVKTRAGRAGNESVEPEDETGIDAGDLSLEIDEISIDEISIDETIPGDGGTVDDGEVTVDEAVEVTVE